MFARSSAASAAFLSPFAEKKPVLAIRHIRKLRGGSQPLLVEGSDGSYYMVKMSGNPLGANALANEFLGSVLAETAGLPVPRIAPVLITENFLTEYADLGFSTSADNRTPRPGTHFGSRFVGDVNDTSRVIGLLSPSHVPRILNRECFLGMYLLDIAANHQHHRQAVFVREGDVLSLKTVFVDHSHMFGGPEWSGSAQNCLPLHRNRNLYMSLWHEDDVSAWIAKLKKRIPAKISEAMPLIPDTWFTGDLGRVQDTLLQRLDRLSQLAYQYRLAEPRSDIGTRSYNAHDPSPSGPTGHTRGT